MAFEEIKQLMEIAKTNGCKRVKFHDVEFEFWESSLEPAMPNLEEPPDAKMPTGDDLLYWSSTPPTEGVKPDGN
jgi:hypothetical protein